MQDAKSTGATDSDGECHLSEIFLSATSADRLLISRRICKWTSSNPSYSLAATESARTPDLAYVLAARSGAAGDVSRLCAERYFVLHVFLSA